MDKIKEKYLELQKIDENIAKLKDMLKDIEATKKDSIDNCEHELIIVYKHGYDNIYGDISYGKCLTCNKNIKLNQEGNIYTTNGMSAKKVNLEDVMDITKIITKDAIENSCFGENFCLEYVQNIFGKIMNLSIDLSNQQVFNMISDGLKQYENEFYEKQLYFKNSINQDEVAIQFANIKMVNAFGEDSVDFCSENMKKVK